MGGTTFDHYVDGANVQDAFTKAHEEATYEHGHGGYSGTIAEKGGYTIITNTPLLESEANALADRLIQDDDPRIRDKWGDAGAIPVIKSTRVVDAKGFTYTPTAGYSNYEAPDPQLLEAVQPLVKLKKGETIQRIEVYSYSTPQANRYSYGRSASPTRSQCQARVVIKKPPMTRKAPMVIEIPAGLDYDQRRKEIQAQVDTMKLKAGEKVVSWHAGQDTPGPAKVTVTAPKGATETRYIVVGKDRNGKTAPINRMGHGDWETGFESQAKAREWLTGVAKNEKNWVSNGPLSWLGDNVVLEIESVTRRASGEPLVQITREVGKRMVDVEVEVKLADGATASTPDGWLFFGWASC